MRMNLPTGEASADPSGTQFVFGGKSAVTSFVTTVRTWFSITNGKLNACVSLAVRPLTPLMNPFCWQEISPRSDVAAN
jgi:hypothetical protein